jgi:radical SAM protein (TIGR01212 family)
MIKSLNRIKPVWAELGLQTIHDETAERIHRGHSTSVFEECYKRLKAAGLTVIVHVILGLPGESREDMLDTVRYLGELSPRLDGIKLQMLNVLEGSQLAEEYRERHFSQMSMEEYTDLVVECLRLLPEQTVIHRMTGDGPRKLLISPKWVTDKKRVMNMLRNKILTADRP